MATQAEIEAAKELLSQWGHDVVASLSLSSGYDIKKVAHAACVLSSIPHEQQPVNERLLEAATELFDEFHEYLPDTLKKAVSQAISAAEAEIEERRKPVTEEWLQSRSWDHCGTRGRCNIYSPSIDVESIRIELGLKTTLLFDSLCKISPTRGDVMIVDELLRVLGGAK